jgi:signal transduction histidine kinase
MMQLVDVSGSILYNIANGEKKLLSLINATVSHEMRNPVNSIHSQNAL